MKEQLLLILVVVFCGSADARQKSRPPSTAQPCAVEAIHRKWLDEDVLYIIADAEKEAFCKLTSINEREEFIKAFWQRRDPDPDTEENEFRAEYYERIAYANENFVEADSPGWRTDRGRIYIMYGKPHEWEKHKDKKPPFEIWFYRHIPGIGRGIELEFLDVSGTGKFKLQPSPLPQ